MTFFLGTVCAVCGAVLIYAAAEEARNTDAQLRWIAGFSALGVTQIVAALELFGVFA